MPLGTWSVTLKSGYCVEVSAPNRADAIEQVEAMGEHPVDATLLQIEKTVTDKLRETGKKVAENEHVKEGVELIYLLVACVVIVVVIGFILGIVSLFV